MIRSPRDLPLVTVFGLGFRRPAPGTWGSLPPVLVAAALLSVGIGPGSSLALGAPLWYASLGLIVLLFSCACVAQGHIAESLLGRNDATPVVAHEAAGMALTLLFLPPAAVTSPGMIAYSLAFAFVAFRVCDIVKPFPANIIQRAPAGWGILLDDLFAGVYAGLAVLAATMALAFGPQG
ncbi:MAG: phosphatidylglycerophosphatase A [Planctomyces sp.]